MVPVLQERTPSPVSHLFSNGKVFDLILYINICCTTFSEEVLKLSNIFKSYTRPDNRPFVNFPSIGIPFQRHQDGIFSAFHPVIDWIADKIGCIDVAHRSSLDLITSISIRYSCLEIQVATALALPSASRTSFRSFHAVLPKSDWTKYFTAGCWQKSWGPCSSFFL